MGGEFWDFSGVPVIEGWYAVVVCYDSYEGMFPAAAYWDGGVWLERWRGLVFVVRMRVMRVVWRMSMILIRD